MADKPPTTEPKTTEALCTWIHGLTLADVPPEVVTRAKHVILDGVACGLVGAHLPWSETAVNAVLDMEPPLPDGAGLFGWEKKITPLSAALLNSAFIQGFELDDWHAEAPVHSSSIVLPALFAAVGFLARLEPGTTISGDAFLLAAIVGFEVGPRVGRALHGAHMLTLGWHSGAVFGPPAAAAAVGKLLGLTPAMLEDALGIACTQACGLMAAQFESDVKRMQHGFAARNGLLGVLLARKGYVGIKKVFERPYGGYLSTFSLGSGKEPPFLLDEVTAGLGVAWKTAGINIKPYAAMAGTHGTVDCVAALQKEHPALMASSNLDTVASITIELGEAAFHHGGWKAVRPLTATGAQMSNAFVAATQMVDAAVLPAQFRRDALARDRLWALVDKVVCVHNPAFTRLGATSVTVAFADGTAITAHTDAAKGVDPPLTNPEIVDKWRALAASATDDEARLAAIEATVVGLDACADVRPLAELLLKETKNPIA